MKKFAVIQFGSKQFMVEEGNVFQIERQKPPFKAEVLYFNDGKKVSIGDPLLKNINVKLKEVEQPTVKTTIARFKSKSRYRKKTGHKQPMSLIKVEKISKKSSKGKE